MTTKKTTSKKRAETVAGAVPGRAKKRAAMERILAAWQTVPSQRLGQLLQNASYGKRADLFQVEDERLARDVEQYAKQYIDAIMTARPAAPSQPKARRAGR